MNKPPLDSTTRFSNRVENYVRYRPTYPEGVLQILREETSLTPDSVIADIGCGTGISSELFLKNGNTVFGVEPNTEMRQAAENYLHQYANFHSIAAQAESTTLLAHSVDYVVAGQAFHWFHREQARAEFARILRPGGWCVLMWNSRRIDSTPFLRGFESLLKTYGTDYQQIQHKNIDAPVLQAFFAREASTARSIYNEQRFNFEGLKGRLLSSSYVPTEEDPNYQPMLYELERLFREFAERDQVCFEYDTELYFGHLA